MSNSNPPKWADWLIDKLCTAHDSEEIQGDLHEAFLWRAKTKGLRKANLLFIWEAFRSIRLTTLKPTHHINQYLMMYRNYIKTGWRFIKKHKVYSTLNILGLSLGLSFCWLAYLYANDETSFDKHLPDHDRLYRIVSDFKRGDDINPIGGSSNSMSVHFKDKIPEIEGVARFKSDFGLIKKDEEGIEQYLIMADLEMIKYLDLHFLEGTAATFDQPNDIVISESLAGKLDLRGIAVGSILSLIRNENLEVFIIRGVYQDIPDNTSIRSDLFISYTNYLANAPERRLTSWFDINMNSLVKLRDPASIDHVLEKMNAIHQENYPDKEDGSVKIKLQPVSDIHLNESYGHYNGISRGGNTQMIKLFLGIGIFCLIISMINYANFNISL